MIAPGGGAIQVVFWGLSTPGDGDHLEKPSVVSFESTTRATGTGRSQQVVTRWFDGQDRNKQALFRGLFCGGFCSKSQWLVGMN